MSGVRTINTTSSFAQIGKVEEIDNVINLIDPDDTPFYSSIKKERVNNTLFQWQTDALPAARNAPRIEDFAYTAEAGVQPTMVSNVTQIITRSARVSRTAMAVDVYGRNNDLDRQMLLNGTALRLDMEMALVGPGPRSDGTDAEPPATSTPRATRGIEHWVDAASAGTGYAAPVSGTAAMTDGTARVLTAAMINAARQLAYERGGKPSILLVAPSQKARISTLAPTLNGAGTVHVNVPVGKLLTGGVSVIETDFGMLKVVPSLQVRSRTALMLDPSKASVVNLRPIQSVVLPPISDSEARLIVVEFGLKVHAPRAHIKIADLT